jgi:anti-sigma regulatory factor (Ser/Thr protein kinase)
VLHAYLDHLEPGPLTAEAYHDDVITDEGIGIVPRAHSPGLGLGLPLITLADQVDIRDSAPTATKVRMTFAVDPGN